MEEWTNGRISFSAIRGRQASCGSRRQPWKLAGFGTPLLHAHAGHHLRIHSIEPTSTPLSTSYQLPFHLGASWVSAHNFQGRSCAPHG